MTKTILLADDSVTIQKVVELTFMDEDFEVASVNNGAEAIARLGEMTPDVVIADVHMPGADGYEVCRRSKELHPAVPVLLLVGTFESFDPESAERCGSDGHLKKPFDSQDLLRRVKELAQADRSAAPRAFAATAATVAASIPLMPPVDEVWDPIADDAEETAFLSATAVASESGYEAVLEPATRFEETAPTMETPGSASGFAPVAVVPLLSAAGTSDPVGPLSDADVDRIARRVIDLLGDKPVRDVAWEVVPDLAEVLLKSRIRELEASVE